MPFAKSERLLRRDDDGKQCQRTSLPHRSGKMTRVVLALDRPAESEAATRKSREGKLEVLIHAPAPGVQRIRRERGARGDQPLARGFAPGLECCGVEAHTKFSL